MQHLQTLDGALLVVVDVQESHFPHCLRRDETLDVMLRVIRAARLAGVPLIVTEHYPKAFGQTVREIREATAGAPVCAKLHFSCLEDPGIREQVDRAKARRLVLIGAETHICICATALKALELGLEVAVVADAVTGRKGLDHALALDRMRAHGADVVTWEMLVYEWMRRGGTELFKSILPLVKG